MTDVFPINVLLLAGVFAFVLVFRRKLARWVLAFPAPHLLLAWVAAIPLTLFEESINCNPSWCGKLVVPWTVPILLGEVGIVLLLSRRFGKAGILPTVFLYCGFGVLWEVFVGGLVHVASYGLFSIFLVLWTALSYAFLIILPLTILHTAKTPQLDIPLKETMK